MKILSTLIISFFLFTLVSCTKSTNDDSKEIAEDQNEEKFEDASLEDDSEFAVKAADAGMMEVQLATLALSNGASAQVKDFAQKMLEDHKKANDELKALAQKKNISLPAALSEENQKKYEDMSKKKGKDFDKDYCDQMVKDHKDVVDMFEKASENANDAEIKAWASEKLPALQHHLSMAEQMKDAEK